MTITVTVRDAAGNPLEGKTVSVEVSGEGNTLTQPSGATNASGVVTGSVSSSLPGLKQVTASVAAESGAVVLDERPTLSFVALPAVKLAFLAQSFSATAGEAISPEIQVAIQDELGRTIDSASNEVSLQLGAGPASAVLEGTLTAQAVQGVAHFPQVVLRQPGAGYKLKATSSGLADAISPSFDVAPGPPANLVLELPTSATAGSAMNAEVTIRDSLGNVATNYRGTVHFSSMDPQSTLPTDYTFTPEDEGHHSFNVVLRTAAISQQITVTDTAVASLSATLSLQIVAAPPALARFPAQPADGRVRTVLQAVRVELVDAFGNRAPVSSPPVAVSLKGGNPASVLSGTVSVNPVDGLATFSDLSLDQEGSGFQLTATAGALAPADSAGFNVVDDIPPAVVVLTSTGQDAHSISLAWTDVGDDGNLGTAARYELRYSTHPITGQADFDAATVATAGTPKAPGSAESFTVTGLEIATSYSFALRVWDQADNASGLQAVQVSTYDPCAGVVCEVPEPTCAADGVSRVTFTSACVLVDELPSCRDTESRSTCPGADGVCFGATCVTASPPEAGELLITELMHNPSSNTTPYVELHNPTQKLLNLSGLQIENEQGVDFHSFPLTSPYPGGAVLIPPGGWFVVAQAGEFDANGGVAVDYALGSTFELNPAGHLRLRAPSGTLIEDFTWSSSFPQTLGRSMNLSSTVADTQANEHSWYWCDSSDNVRLLGGDSGTPGQPNETCGLTAASTVQFCNIQYPKTFPEPQDPMTYPAVIPYGARKTAYSQFWTPGVTDWNGLGNDYYPHVQVELGYGSSVDPATWQWSAARFNPFYDSSSPAFNSSNDEIFGWLRIFTPGTYSYGFRYRLYDPVAHSFSGYAYCDQNGVAVTPSTGSYGSVTVGTEPLGPTGHVVISELATRGMQGVTINEDDEFLELYNPTSAPVDISGWKVQYMPSEGSSYQDLVAVPQGASIAANGYYLIAHTGYAGSVAPDLQYTQAIPSTGGNVRIGNGTVGPGITDSFAVDTLGWGSAFAPEGDAAPVAGAGGSLERKAALQATSATMEGGADALHGNGIDSDWNADDFVTRTVRGPQNSASPAEAP